MTSSLLIKHACTTRTYAEILQPAIDLAEDGCVGNQFSAQSARKHKNDPGSLKVSGVVIAIIVSAGFPCLPSLRCTGTRIVSDCAWHQTVRMGHVPDLVTPLFKAPLISGPRK
jgi:hypothetical protein